MAAKRPMRTPRDRWADWAVIVVLIVALLLGWGVKSLAESQKNVYTDAETALTVRYPKGWILQGDENQAFQAVNPDSGEFKTTYQVGVRPAAIAGPVTPTLSIALNNASMMRAQQGTAYRLFDLVEGVTIDDQPSMEATYVFVVESGDFFSQHMPVVVMGLDIAVARGNNIYVHSLLAAKDDFEAAEEAFRKFVESAEYE